MHLVDAKGILSRNDGQYGMNIYRGCSHGCIYCDSRSKCYHFTHAFEDIEVKQNAPEDDNLCALLEPDVCNTKRRIEVLEKMKERGIPTMVWLTPILPFINDTEDNIRAILNECVRLEVKGIVCFDMGVTLRDGDREYFYAALDRHFPGMKQKYIQTYRNAYMLPSPDSPALMKIFRDVCKEHDILYKPDDCFRYLNEFPEKNEQLTLF